MVIVTGTVTVGVFLLIWVFFTTGNCKSSYTLSKEKSQRRPQNLGNQTLEWNLEQGYALDNMQYSWKFYKFFSSDW